MILRLTKVFAKAGLYGRAVISKLSSPRIGRLRKSE